MSSLSPLLNSGLIFASFHILGNDPVQMFLSIIYTRLGAIILADILNIFGPILSKAVDLFTFKFDKTNSYKPNINQRNFKFNIVLYFRLHKCVKALKF